MLTRLQKCGSPLWETLLGSPVPRCCPGPGWRLPPSRSIPPTAPHPSPTARPRRCRAGSRERGFWQRPSGRGREFYLTNKPNRKTPRCLNSGRINRRGNAPSGFPAGQSRMWPRPNHSGNDSTTGLLKASPVVLGGGFLLVFFHFNHFLF